VFTKGLSVSVCCLLYHSVWISYDACCDQHRPVLTPTVKRRSLPMLRNCKSWTAALSNVFPAEQNQLIILYKNLINNCINLIMYAMDLHMYMPELLLLVFAPP